MLIVTLLVIILPFGLSKKDEIAVLILARGGSKGVHLKNLQKVGGVSLLTRAIQTAKLSQLNSVTVSTDHPLIAIEALKSGAQVFQRSYLTASDWAPSIWGASEFLFSRPNITILVLLQATSPFIKSSQIRIALEKVKYNTFDCAFSVTRSFKLRWQEKNDVVSPLNFNIQFRPRRQDWSGELLESGAFYIARKSIIEEGHFQNHNCTVVEVSPLESLEIDTYADLELADALIRSNLI